jgi:tetratricopeptide (TPR) repeat protein
MGVLLVLVLGYVARPYWYSQVAGYPTRPVVEPPLAGKNSVSNLVVRQNDSGLWQASFDYFYTGEPRFVLLSVELPLEQGQRVQDAGFWGKSHVPAVKRGLNHATVDINHPGSQGTTRQVVVKMQDPSIRNSASDSVVIASAQIDQLIDWPSWQTWTQDREFAKQSPEENLDRAIALIDSGARPQLDEAKSMLERLISRNPSLEQGYIELARVAMKTNWGPEGLHHAEGLLSSALQIKPESANARILMGYVYAHQKRYPQAEKLFTEAAASNPTNLWLWANWGEALVMQGKLDQAAAKYREAIERPMTHDTYDRARADAYTRLLALLERKDDLDGMETLYKKRVAEFGNGSCYTADYARFLLQQRGDAHGAIDLARKALNLNCHDADARQILGLAHYVVWSKSEGAPRVEALNQARIYLPPGPMPMYLLASSDKTASVVSQLIASGEKIDQKDNEKLNALAHAIEKEDLPTMRRLLRLGAKPETPVGYGEVPVALMPVMNGNLEMIKLMQQFGADYATIRYQGATAFEVAKQAGDTELLEALSYKPRVL